MIVIEFLINAIVRAAAYLKTVDKTMLRTFKNNQHSLASGFGRCFNIVHLTKR